MEENFLRLKALLEHWGTIYIYLTSILKNVYIHKLDNTANEYNNSYDNKIKMRLVDVKSSRYTDFVEDNEKKYIVPWTYVIADIKGENLLDRFTKRL